MFESLNVILPGVSWQVFKILKHKETHFKLSN